MAIKQTFIVGFSCFLCACGSAPETAPGDIPATSGGRSDCISTRTIRDYRVLDDANLVVTAHGRRKYHVTLSRRAVGLRASWKIGFRSTSGRVCGGFDDILVDDGFGPERVRHLHAEHAEQRQELDRLVDQIREASSHDDLTASVTKLAEMLRVDIEEEEREYVNEKLLHDHIMPTDTFGG